MRLFDEKNIVDFIWLTTPSVNSSALLTVADINCLKFSQVCHSQSHPPNCAKPGVANPNRAFAYSTRIRNSPKPEFDASLGPESRVSLSAPYSPRQR